MLLVHDLEAREALLMSVQMVRSLEGFIYVLLVVFQMGSFLVILVKIHCDEELVQIVYLIEAHPVGFHMVELIEV